MILARQMLKARFAAWWCRNRALRAARRGAGTRREDSQMDVEAFLRKQQIPYEAIDHRPTDSAAETSTASGVAPARMAKVVLLKADHGFEYVIAVVPADRDLDLQKASHALGDSELAFADEQEVAQRCPDCEDHILLPFGAAYHLKCLVDEHLAQQDEIVFRCNTRDRSIRVRFDDFHNIEKPSVVPLSKD